MASTSHSLTTVQDEDYFPSFLTALQSTPKSDKSKESTPSVHSESNVLSSKAKPRLTFAESLSMDRSKQSVKIPDDSPFSFGGRYQDSLGTRRRKNGISQQTTDDKDTENDDVPPPPTMSLLHPVGFNAESFSVDDEEAAAARRKAAIARDSYYPDLHSDEWGQDKQYWVTVFGFPSSAQSFILHQFQDMGEVINYSSSSGGNWLHLRYHTRLQAEKALSYDGRMLANSIMVGVKKCYPSDRSASELIEAPVSNYFGAQTRQTLGSRDLEVDPTDADIMLPPQRRQDIFCNFHLSLKMLPSIVPRIQQKILEHQIVTNSPKLTSILSHPAGPFTVHFWAPTFKWAISIANIADMRRSPEHISVAQQAAVTATGLIWSRYSLVITPKNWNLFAVNVFMAGTGLTQFYRKFTYNPKKVADAA
ncbi:mitochondrial pyruvate carrier 2-like [Plasmopara halstedii]|uniref:Mitochondrial pyruvate carrier n=1 Tax=Plasmopara halstedii TaxID=4781 RepID=A0A0P1ATS7_PLAHL|nr:mitochondrial pyruvate carrier 2-like [Plasmopara halstedii]CEG44351.1 mitochondrial pyruvate carrier 2-like [Plasmopara halstedii]|eukprot:XP_024580720.1 mitochondrial pyruvate carrier 2-like [Plasmopara halstedii]